MPRNKAEDNKKERTIFIRVSPKERRIIERAIQKQYGEVDGYISHFARRAMLLVSKKILTEGQVDQEGEE